MLKFNFLFQKINKMKIISGLLFLSCIMNFINCFIKISNVNLKNKFFAIKNKELNTYTPKTYNQKKYNNIFVLKLLFLLKT